MAHKAPYRDAKPYDENDGESACTSRTSFDRLDKYRKVGKKKYGPDYDPTKHNLDPELVMISGNGKSHGTYVIGNGIISPASHLTLPQIKARQTRSSPSTSIQTRSTPAVLEMQALLTEERRASDEKFQAMLAEERQAADEKLQAALAKQTTQYWDMLAVMCAQQGLAPPEKPTFTPITPHPSGIGSNDPASSHADRSNNLGSSPLL